MRHTYQMQYKRVLLRPLEERDIEELRVLRNQNRSSFDSSDCISPEQQKAWFQHYLNQENDVMFAVELVKHPSEFIGAIAVYAIDWKEKTAEIGRTVIDKRKAPMRGIGTEATLAACCAAFKLVGISKLVARALKTNEASCKMHQKVGYAVVGESEKHWHYEMTPDILNL